MVYKGPQFIVSNPPHPDNVIQTIRQPDLVKPPKLPAPLPLPPMVAIAPSRPVLAPQPTRPAAPVDPAPHQDAEQVAVSKPIIVPSPQAPVEAPKLPLPAASSANALLHAVTDASNPAAIPKLAARRPIPGKPNNEVRNLLVVDAIPFPERKLAAMPSGELSGAFAVSPIPTDVHPGAMAAPAAAGRAELKDGVGHGHGNASVGMGGAHGAGTGDGRGLSSAGGKAATAGGTGDSGVGHGSGRTGTGRGKDTGDLGAGLRGSSKGTDNGSGAGAGAGNSPFSGITIQGGKGSSGFGIIGAPKVSAVKPQTSYGMTIISSGSSGGGFKDFGVFRNEAAYTVYLNMADAGINGPNWTLQYALYSVPDSSSVSRGLLAPPFAISKALPQFPLEIAKRNHGSLVVVYGVINASGKFEDLRVMQSPDVALNPSLLEALEKWMFQPAEVDGSHVAVKVLLGVPVGLFSGV
jgi:TonB family protein